MEGRTRQHPFPAGVVYGRTICIRGYCQQLARIGAGIFFCHRRPPSAPLKYTSYPLPTHSPSSFRMKYYLLPFFAIVFCQWSPAQSMVGTWKTVDDNTGEARSHIQIFAAGGKFYGKIEQLLQKPPSLVCDKCPGDRKDQPLMGMVLLVNMVLSDGMWQSGDILDPEKGKWYSCKMWLQEGDANTLVVRGYLGPFYRTQYWHRVQ